MKIKWKSETDLCVREKDGVTYLIYPRLAEEDFLVHGFSTRLGGVSEGHLASMNLSFTRGDDPENVKENHRRIGGAMGFCAEDLVFSDQTHTTNIRVVTEEDRGKGITKPRDYTDIDGMITNVPGIVLTTSYADCVPLYFADPVHKAVGLAHSGWKGTVGRIGEKMVQAMEAHYGTKPEDLITAIGPSICQDCYEVSEDVIDRVRESFPAEESEALFYGKENGKYQLNLWEACRRTLLQAGVPAEQILMPGLCTCCNPDFLFSHRASKGKRGNLSAFLGVRA